MSDPYEMRAFGALLSPLKGLKLSPIANPREDKENNPSGKALKQEKFRRKGIYLLHFLIVFQEQIHGNAYDFHPFVK